MIKQENNMPSQRELMDALFRDKMKEQAKEKAQKKED